MLHRGSNCSLARAMGGRIMRCGIISSRQSAATSEIVKALLGMRCRACKQRYIKYGTGLLPLPLRLVVRLDKMRAFIKFIGLQALQKNHISCVGLLFSPALPMNLKVTTSTHVDIYGCI